MASGRMVGYVGAVEHLATLGVTITVGALRSRVSRRTIPHRRRRGDRVVMFDTAELETWAAGELVPVKEAA